MAYEKYTIEQFMQAWFHKNYEELSEEEFKIVRAEYEDTSGLYLTEDFEMISFIYHLKDRINYVKIFIKLQREFIQEFDIPFLRDLPVIKEKYGYVLKWNNDKEDFENQLKKVELREIKHSSLLDEKIKEYDKIRSKNPIKNEDDDLVKSRISFIRMLNSLGKIGYKLDRRTTYVDELSLMIKQQIEETEEQNRRYANR